MRLDKFIANNTAYSRSEVKRFIKQKRVSVNGQVVASSELKVAPENDKIEFDNQTLKQRKAQYYMLHKPVNVVCANTDAEHSTVLDLLTTLAPHLKSKLQIAGRLDIDTTGLVLITDDGDWNHKITSPNSACVKRYCVELEKPFDENTLVAFKDGMLLEGEDKKTRPALIKILSKTRVELAISEGRYHQVKRMFLHTGNRVINLHRKSVGNIVLDEKLLPGQYRHLNDLEIRQHV